MPLRAVIASLVLAVSSAAANAATAAYGEAFDTLYAFDLTTRSALPLGPAGNWGGTTLANLVRMLSGRAGRPVVDRPIVDQTGLEGNYAVRLKFASDSPLPVASSTGTPPPPGDRPSIFTAVQEQLGLKLEPATMQGQVLVIDHIERPTEN